MGEMIKGNVAIAEAAIRNGARLYAGYPITPSTEIMEYVAERMPQVGGVFIQAESELAGIHMVNGASAVGVRAFTASSGPGISLKQEGITCLSDEENPALVINVSRYGNGISTLLTGQSDYLRDTRGGGNGDYRCFVLCPNSIQEAVDLVGLGFDLAEKYRMVSVLMTEGALGQMMETADLPPMRETKRYPWGMDGHYTNPKIGIFDRNPVTEARDFIAKYKKIKETEQRWEDHFLDDAEYVFIAIGMPARSTLGAVQLLREKGEKVGMIRPITAWPYPEKAFEKVNKNVKGFITVEANATGQLVDDVALTAKKLGMGHVPIYTNPHIFGIPSLATIQDDYYKVVNGELKEVY